MEATLFSGFYPAIHDRNIPAQDWLGNYYRTYLERDVRDLLAVGDLDTFSRFVSLCAGRNAQIVNLSSLASDCGISHTTASRWLSVLMTSFLVVLLRPYHRNFNKRLIKSPKLYFLDTGLLCYLLRIRSADDLAMHSARGSVFESFVVSELWKRRVHAGAEPDLFFWRDSAGHEVDIVVDGGAHPIAVEVKSGRTIAADQFRGLDYWAALEGQEQAAVSVLAYGGDQAIRRHQVQVRPWWAL
jgi:predicted AAA+ superfamily ATPase